MLTLECAAQFLVDPVRLAPQAAQVLVAAPVRTDDGKEHAAFAERVFDCRWKGLSQVQRGAVGVEEDREMTFQAIRQADRRP